VDPSGHYVVSIGCRFEASAFLGGYCVIAINAGKTYVSCTLTKGFRVSATIQVSLTVFSTIYFNKNISNLPGWGMSSGFSCSTKIGGLSASGGVDILPSGKLAPYGSVEYGKTIGISVPSAYIEMGYTKEQCRYKKSKMSKTEKSFKVNGKTIKRKAFDNYVRFRYVSKKVEVRAYKNSKKVRVKKY